MVLKIRGNVIRYYRSNKSCNYWPIYSVFNFRVQGERGGGVDTFSGEEFLFSALVLVLVLFNN